jgi:arylsulfatase
MYGVMDEVFQFAASFKDFPPRSFPPSFNPANILESEMDGIKRRESFKKNLDLDRIRGGLNRMIDEQIQQRGVK